MRTLRILICTAWSPTHSEYLLQYSNGVFQQNSEHKIEIFLTTTFAKDKFKSIVGSMIDAQKYALEYNFTHLFNLEADRYIGKNTLKKMLEIDSDVVVGAPTGSLQIGEETSHISNVNSSLGWGCMLVKTDVLKVAPFNIAISDSGEWPDRRWFKYCLHRGINVLACEIDETILKPSSTTWDLSFAPNIL